MPAERTNAMPTPHTDITETLGARLMIMQAELLAERSRSNPEGWDYAFDQLMHGPEARLLYSIWPHAQRQEFVRLMLKVRNKIEQQAGAVH